MKKAARLALGDMDVGSVVFGVQGLGGSGVKFGANSDCCFQPC